MYRQKARIALFNVVTPMVSEDPFDHYSLMNLKHYHSEGERVKRRNIWTKNVEFINNHNANPNKKTKRILSLLSLTTYFLPICNPYVFCSRREPLR